MTLNILTLWAQHLKLIHLGSRAAALWLVWAESSWIVVGSPSDTAATPTFNMMNDLLLWVHDGSYDIKRVKHSFGQ